MGVSPDSLATLERYAREKETPFSFVSDSDRQIAKAYQTGKASRQARVTVVIARGGQIAQTMHHEFLIPKHVSTALEIVRGL